MNKILLLLGSLLLAASCSSQLPVKAAPEPMSLFVGVDVSALPEPARSAASSAQQDISLVLSGRPPACKSEPDNAMSDGGTSLYKCKYYDLTVMRSIYKLGNVSGYLYGPIVNFPGDYPISYVRFFSDSEFQSLKETRHGP